MGDTASAQVEADLMGLPAPPVSQIPAMEPAHPALAPASLCLAILLAGCSVGPKFVKPEPQVKPAWSQANDTLFEVRTRPDSAWWTVFGDSILNRLVGTAYRQNLPLQIWGVRIMESRAQLAVAVGRQFPQVQVLMGSASAVQVSENTPLGRVADQNYLSYSLGFDAAWEVDLWGKYRSDVQAQAANHMATAAEYDNALVSLTAEVARTYAAIRTFQVLIDLAWRNVRLQEEGLRIAQARFGAGATSELDVAQATTLLESTRASIPRLEISLAQSQNALATLLGQPMGSVQAMLQDSARIPAASRKIPLLMPAELLKRRPDVRNAELLAVAQNARIGVAKADFYPSFVLFGSVGLQSSAGASGVSSNLFDAGSLYYAVGPRLAWTLLNYGRLTNNVRVQDARLQQLLLNYGNTVLRAAQEVEDGLVGYVKSRDAADLSERAAASARRSADLAMIQYREGAVTYERVLDAQRSLLQEENAVAQARSNIATNLIAVYKSLGGGWELRRGQPVVSDSTKAQMQRRTRWGDMLTEEKAPEPLSQPEPEREPAKAAPPKER